MKTNDNIQPHDEILAKYLGGEMSGDELHDFENEYAFSEVNRNSIEKMKTLWSAMKGYKEQKSPDTRTAWNKLHTRLDEEKLIPNQFTETNRRIIPVFIRAAAVILILLGFMLKKYGWNKFLKLVGIGWLIASLAFIFILF